MSAYVVDREHIEYLVNAAMLMPHFGFSYYWQGKRRELNSGDAEEAMRIGQMLWNECVASVSHRYPNDAPDSLPGPVMEPGEGYFYGPHRFCHCPQLDPVQVIKACHCYAYQSCEHPEWEASEAYAFVSALESIATHYLPGYEKAEWGAPQAAYQTRSR
jgi:hypothetical protein